MVSLLQDQLNAISIYQDQFDFCVGEILPLFKACSSWGPILRANSQRIAGEFTSESSSFGRTSCSISFYYGQRFIFYMTFVQRRPELNFEYYIHPYRLTPEKNVPLNSLYRPFSFTEKGKDQVIRELIRELDLSALEFIDDYSYDVR